MKILFSLLFALSLSSCGTIAGVESVETQAYRNQMLQPGVDIAAFKRVYGEPQSVDFTDGTYTGYFENRGKPIYVSYRDNKIIGWKHDLEQKPAGKQKCLSQPNGSGGFLTVCK